jgi:hypothetical protein
MDVAVAFRSASSPWPLPLAQELPHKDMLVTGDLFPPKLEDET